MYWKIEWRGCPGSGERCCGSAGLNPDAILKRILGGKYYE